METISKNRRRDSSRGVEAPVRQRDAGVSRHYGKAAPRPVFTVAPLHDPALSSPLHRKLGDVASSLTSLTQNQGKGGRQKGEKTC